jgi:heparin binding hemagglutinin HbhA
MTMTTSTTTRKIPTPLYAAAGAGDLAYQQLRKLPAQVAQLRARVEELRPAVTDVVAETNLRADLTVAADRLRDAARRNTSSLLAGAQVAQDKAFAVYTELVNRGEKVVAGGRTAEAKIEIEPASKTVTTEVAVTPTPADVAPAVTTKPQVASTTVPAAASPAKKTTAAKKTAAAKK